MIEKIYKSSDGKEFNSYEECLKHEKIPKVWICYEVSLGHSNVTGVFFTKQEADLYAKETTRIGCNAVTQCFTVQRYKKQKVKIPISDPYVVSKTKWEKLKNRFVNFYNRKNNES